MSTLKLLRLLPDLLSHPYHWHQVDFLESAKLVGLRLHKEEVQNKGEVIAKNWYAESHVNPDGTMSYSDLVIKEEFAYTRDSNGFAICRDGSITWYCEDESAHSEKKNIPRKYYTPLQRIQERKTRRTNVVDDLKTNVLGWIMFSEPTDFATALAWGQTFFSELQSEILEYIEVNTSSIVTAITNDTTTSWLDNTIQGVPLRAMILDALDLEES